MTPLLDKKQVAILFNVSVKTINKWVSDKKIPFIKAGVKLVRFNENELKNYIERRTIKAKA